MAPTASREQRTNMNLYVICTFNIGGEGSMALGRSKRTYTSRWDVCGSLPLRFKDMGTPLRPDRRERHYKTNHRLALEFLKAELLNVLCLKRVKKGPAFFRAVVFSVGVTAVFL